MALLVSAAQLRDYLELGDDASGDAALTNLLTAAQRAIELYLDRSIETDAALTDADRLLIGQAVLITAGEQHDMRGGDGTVPAMAMWMLRGLRSWAR